jgi:hypothetical protein
LGNFRVRQYQGASVLIFCGSCSRRSGPEAPVSFVFSWRRGVVSYLYAIVYRAIA